MTEFILFTLFFGDISQFVPRVGLYFGNFSSIALKSSENVAKMGIYNFN